MESILIMYASSLYMSEERKNSPLIPDDRYANTRRLLTIRVTESEYRAIKDNANKYANGNMSAWIRYSALNMIPLGEHINKATSEQLEQLSLSDLNSVAESNLDE